VELAVRRILLIHGIVLSIGGIPLIYLGDEIAALNDYSFQDDPALANDSRWVHRPKIDRARYSHRDDPSTVEGRVYQGLRKLIALRKSRVACQGGALQVIPTENDHVLGYIREHTHQRVVIFANFSESVQVINARVLELVHFYGLECLYGRSDLPAHGNLILAPLDLFIVG
jgi:glycosidase